MMFAFARDGGIPHRLPIIDRGFHSPIRTVLFGAGCSFLLALPSLGSTVAFYDTIFITTIGLYLSYGILIAMTLAYPRNFKRGSFTLGALSKSVSLIPYLWIAFIIVVFCLPTENPISSQTLNYTPVALTVVTLFAFGSWLLWARHWFTGRCRHHCRICIRQLDFLGEEMVYRSDTVDSSDGRQRLKSTEGSSSETTSNGGFHHHRQKSGETDYGRRRGDGGGGNGGIRAGLKSKAGDQKISVEREFEVYSAPAREYQEVGEM